MIMALAVARPHCLTAMIFGQSIPGRMPYTAILDSIRGRSGLNNDADAGNRIGAYPKGKKACHDLSKKAAAGLLVATIFARSVPFRALAGRP